MQELQKITGAELARIAGVSRQAVAAAARRGRLVPGADGRFNPEAPDVVYFLEIHRLKGSFGQIAVGSLEVESVPAAPAVDAPAAPMSDKPPHRATTAAARATWDKRKVRAQARRYELALAKEAGRLFDRCEVERSFSAFAAAMQENIFAFDEREGPALHALARSGTQVEFSAALHERLAAAVDRIIDVTKKEIRRLSAPEK